MNSTIKNLLTLLVMLFCVNLVQAQNPKLNKYIFGEGLVFSGEDGHKMELTGYAQPYYETSTYSNDSFNDYYTRVRMRRIRLRLSGDVEQLKMDYRFQLDLSGTSEVGDGTSNYLMDAWIAYNPTSRIKIKFGQSATPTDNRELTMGSQSLQLVERSKLTSAFSTIREFGIFAQGNFRTGGGTYLRPYLTITNGDGLNVYNKDHGGLKVGGRVDFLPFGLFTNMGQYRQVDMMRELTPKLVIGANYSVNNGMSSRRGRNSGAILYLNDSLQESLPDYTKFGIDFLFKYKGFSMLGEFVTASASVPTDIKWRVRNDGSTSASFDVNGKQDVENYVKGRMMLGSAYNIQAGYIFKNLYSIDARYTHLKADEYSFLNNGTFYNQPNHYTFGVSKYLTKGYGFKVQTSITYSELAPWSNDIYSNPVSGGEWTYRLITSIAF
jgi:hypothetical protein